MKSGAVIGGIIILLVIIVAIAFSRRPDSPTGATAADTTNREALVSIDGSSTVYPITEAVAEEFQKEKQGQVKVTVGISGTGGGFKKFCNGETDISDASRPIKTTEVDQCNSSNVQYIELPVAYDGLAVVVNSKNTWVDHLTVAELKKMWEPDAQGKVTKWNQIRPNWPNQEIHLYGPGVDSGTFDYFTEAIVGKEDSSRGDYTSSEDDNVLVQGVSNDPLALGFFGVAYYEQNKDKLKVVPIDDEKADNGNGPILPDYNNILQTIYQPLSRPLFIYVSTKALDKPEVTDFANYYLQHAEQLVREVGYIAFNPQAYDLVKQRLSRKDTGSLFTGGSQVGVKIEDILQLK